ncbi:T9SS type A sorting domain-containing protein [Pontibacter sp. KCTC 32443]|uniref:T9SS type A sorting domain-containing protein n=1 Tax=Pontibacter TaxID=323449 RepID=UPI00164D63A3|nr:MULTISPECIES: T9SS type A sorting domain-containing protein [Pontibacter]MBC5776024.1 T9SS type A sorting domain-containing protein [Pontibacter sp. KCTC 32443]
METELVPHTSDEQKISSKRNADVRTLIGLTILICLMLLYSQLCSAQVIRSAASGPWNSASTWAGGTIPQASSSVQLLDGHVVTISNSVSCNSIEVVPPPNNDKNFTKTELVLASGASLTASTLHLNSKNDRRYTSLINNGATITVTSLTIGNGSVVENIAGKIAVTGNTTNDGNLVFNTSVLEIGGTYSGTGIFTKGTGTVKYTGSTVSGQSIAPLAYHHLQLAGNNTKTAAGAFTVSGNLQVEPNTTLRAGLYNHSITGDILNNGTLASETAQATSITIGGDMVNTGTTSAGAATYYVSGDWANAGTLQAGTSTIVLQGNTLQQISGNNTFYNLQFTGTAQAQMLQDITITNGISVTQSHLVTGTNTLWLGNNAALVTPETDAAHIIGTVQTSRTLAPAITEDFGKIGLTLSRNNVDPGVITVERLTGVTTTITDGTESVTRQYNISRSDTNDITALAMNMEMTFLPNELKSKPLNEYKLYNKGQNQEAMPVQSTAVSTNTMRHTNSNRFGTFTLAPPIMPMPVELVWFKAHRQDRVITLQWKTASEQDNKGFEVQVSADGYTYNTIGFVPSKSPDSKVAQGYSFTHNNPISNRINYYRLKQLDYSGEVSYSRTNMVDAASATFTFQVSPNPFKDYVLFASDATTVQVTMTDLNGKPVLSQNLSVQDITAEGYFKLNTGNLATSGLYFLTIQTPEQVYRTKLLKQ